MYNKTIIRFGFCDIQNKQVLGKGYQPQPSASADDPYLDSDDAYSYMYILGDGANPSSKWRLHPKVRIINCIFGDRDRKQNFSTFRLRILEI